MNRWFVVHDLLAFEQHPDMIGNVVKKTGIAKPKYRKFGRIQKNDLIVYYATKDMVVVAVFQVISDIQYIPRDPYWGEIMIFKIEPFKTPVDGKYLDFKKLVTASGVSFDTFPEKTNWGKYMQGRTCILLSDKDYFTIEKALSQKEYMKSRKQINITTTRWHEKYGKAFERLLASLSNTEKRTLRVIMSFEEKGHRLVSGQKLVRLLRRVKLFQDIHQVDDSLKKLNRKRLLKFKGTRRGQLQFSLTKRGRTIGRLVRMHESAELS